MVNVGVDKNQAIRDAISMMTGKKLIQDGEYAVLELGDFEYRYYERRNGNWRLDEELSDKMPDDAIFCNLKEKCLNIKDKGKLISMLSFYFLQKSLYKLC